MLRFQKSFIGAGALFAFSGLSVWAQQTNSPFPNGNMSAGTEVPDDWTIPWRASGKLELSRDTQVFKDAPVSLILMMGDWHPSIKTHEIMAEKLVATLRQDLSW